MWLSDFEIVLEDRVLENGAVRIEDGRIAEIRDRPVAGADVSGRGRLLLPGFIDMHGDMIEREIEPRPNVRMPMETGIFELDKKLATSGITTAYAAVSFNPASSSYGHLRAEENTRRMIETLVAARGALLVDHRVHARFEVTFLAAHAVVEDLLRLGALDLISLTDHTPGQGQYRDVEKFILHIAKARGVGEAEAAEIVRQRIANSKEQTGSIEVIHALAALAAERGVPLASHDDDSPEKVALLHGLGAAISEFPVTAEAASEARRRGLATAMGAPNVLRGLSYSGNLSARDAYAAGLLDILASDYHPAAMLPAILILAEAGPGGLPAAAALASANPARALGLSDRGRIAQGLRADLVIAERGSTPRLRATLRAGRPVWSDGSIGTIPVIDA